MIYNLPRKSKAKGTFTGDGFSFTMEIGMTWRQWCDSTYNTKGEFFIESGSVIWESSGDWYYLNNVAPDDVIQNGGAYKTDYE